MLKTQFLTQYCRKFHVYFQYYVHFSRNSYFLIVVPHIFWVRIFIYKGTFAPLPPLLKGKGGDAPPRPPPPFRRPCKNPDIYRKTTMRCPGAYTQNKNTTSARRNILFLNKYIPSQMPNKLTTDWETQAANIKRCQTSFGHHNSR
jgi:hypothetical protein